MRSVLFFQDWRKVLLLIFFVGAFLRFFHLGEVSLVADEFLDINASYGYFKTGEWQSWDFNNERIDTRENQNADRDERALLYKWQVAQLFYFLSPAEAHARLVSVVWGLITLMLTFHTAVYCTKKKSIGLIAAFLYAVSVSALVMDRRLRMYAMFVPTYLFFSWMVYRMLEERYRGNIAFVKKVFEKFGVNLLFVVPAFVSGAISAHLHLLTANIAFVVLAYAGVRLWQDRAFAKRFWKKYAGIVVGFFAILAGAKFAIPETFQLFASSFSFPDNHYEYFAIVSKDYSHALFACLMFVFGARYLLKGREHGKEGLWVLLSCIVPLFLAVFAWDRNVGEQYIAFIQPFKMMVMSAGIYALATFFETYLKQPFASKAFAISLGASLVFFPNYGYFLQENNVYRQNSSSDNPPYRKVFTYVKKKYIPGEVVVTRDLRGYYFSGLHAPVENLGGEITKDKLALERLQSILAQYSHGWVVLSDNDEAFVSHDAMTFIEKNMERVSNDQVRGRISVYRW
jgi:hypothetical protein